MRREIGERWSFIWLLILLFDLVCGTLLISHTLRGAIFDEVMVVVEQFEKGEGHIRVTNSAQHFDELTADVIVNEKSLDMLAHLIYGEAGSKHLPDEMQIATGSVLLNRIKSPLFPNDMESCIKQEGQYSCLTTGYLLTPDARTYANARYLLINGSQLPENVLFQSQFKQGDGVYKKIGNQYYCYKN